MNREIGEHSIVSSNPLIDPLLHSMSKSIQFLPEF